MHAALKSAGATEMPLEAMRLLDWLTSDDLRDPDGWLLSWHGNARSFPYPEASAYLLHLLARWPTPLPSQAARRLSELQQCIERQLLRDGALQRNGVFYVFDTAIGIAALAAVASKGFEVSCAAIEAGAKFVADGVSLRSAFRLEGAWREDARWSLRFEPHLLKCLRATRSLRTLGVILDIDQLLFALIEQQRGDGAFVISNAGIIDLHVHAYALEGLLGASAYFRSVALGVSHLSEIQLAHGGFPRHVPGPSENACCDVTAQAIRLFALADRDRYASNIERGFAYLRRLEHPQGGLRYNPSTTDCPTWGAVFACQAHLIQAGLHDVGDLI